MRARAAALAVAAILGGAPAAGAETEASRPRVIPASQALAAGLPIADMHLHPDASFSPDQARQWMDRAGVRWAGGGVKVWAFHLLRTHRNYWQDFSRALGQRFIPIAGQSELNLAFRQDGVAGMEDANNPNIRLLLREAEEHFKAGRIKGIGTLFINNRSAHDNKFFRRKARGDAPAYRRLFDLVAKYRAVLVVHTEPDADSLAQFERLLAGDRRARVLWNQCGSYTTAAQVRVLFERHPNLFCELSWRYPPIVPPRLRARFIFDADGHKAAWLKLIEDHADRFMIGNDGLTAHEYAAAAAIVRRGLLPYLRPQTARKVAFENAQRLFDLK